MSGPSRTSAGLGRPIDESDLGSALATKIDTRAPQGRTAPAITALGTAGSMTLTSDDDQGEVDIDITLTAAAGVFTVNGLETTTRVKVWAWIIQDATGNRQLDIKNGTTGDQQTVDIGQNAGDRTLLLLKTNDSGQTLRVVDQEVVSSGGSGSGIPNATITGTPGAPNVLTATPPAIFKADTVQYQWISSSDGGATWSAISGATSSTYTQVSGDAGKEIDCQVWGTPLVTSGSPILVPNTNVTFVATANQSTGTATALHVLRPTGATDGDVLFAAITIPIGSTVTVTPPATTGGTDWTAMGSGANQTANGVTGAGRYQESSGVLQFLYWKRLAAGDATTTWTFTASASSSYRSRTVAFRNAHSTGTPFEAFTQAFGGASTTVSVPSVTPGGTGRMQVVVVSFAGATDITWPASPPTLTEAEGSDYQKFGYNYLGASSGATTAFTGTASAANHKSVAEFLVIP